jgi:hypothetical protein
MDTTNPAETCSKQLLNASTVLWPHKPIDFEKIKSCVWEHPVEMEHSEEMAACATDTVIKSSRLPSCMREHYRSAEPHLVSGSTQWRWNIQRRWQHVPQIQ